MWSNTGNAGFSVEVRASWAVSDTVSVQEDWVAFAGGAASARVKEEVEWKVSEIAQGGESEIVSVPDGWDLEISAIVVQDESVESVEIDNITGQVGSGAVNKTGRWDVSIEKISSDLDVLEFTAVSDVAD